MKIDLETALIEAEHRVRVLKEPLEGVLSSYPEHAEELRVLLAAGDSLSAWAQTLNPDPGRTALGRARFLAAAAQARRGATQSSTRAGAGGWLANRFFKSGALALAGFAAVVGGGGGLVVASAHALPSSPLYGVRGVVEHARIVFASTPKDKTQLELAFALERLDQAKQEINAGGDQTDAKLLLADATAYDAQAVVLAHGDSVLLGEVEQGVMDQTASLGPVGASTTQSGPSPLDATRQALAADATGNPVELVQNPATGELVASPLPVESPAPGPSPTGTTSPTPVSSPTITPSAVSSPPQSPTAVVPSPPTPEPTPTPSDVPLSSPTP